MAQIINGKEISAQIKDEVKQQVDAYRAQGREATLAVVLVGDDAASAVYVRNKQKTCEQVGVRSLSYVLPSDSTEKEVLDLIDVLNHRDDVHGILVQLPLPKQIDEQKVILAISPRKDVDGFHPYSQGALLTGEEGFLPCTPAGIVELIKRSGISIEGKHCVVAGRSNIVGKPAAVLMLRENATVTIVHSRTKNLKEVCKTADILIAAIGKPKFFNSEYIKEGAVVIDVGIHRMEDNKLCGDVDFDDVESLASAITPVPGGVGPMTIAMLMKNCIHAMEML